MFNNNTQMFTPSWEACSVDRFKEKSRVMRHANHRRPFCTKKFTMDMGGSERLGTEGFGGEGSSQGLFRNLKVPFRFNGNYPWNFPKI